MASTILPLIHTLQAAFSAYSLYLASISISSLREYEEKSEKAAEWSSTAEYQLHKTRTTKASGTGAHILTLLTSTTLILQPLLTSSPFRAPTVLGAAALNSVVLVAAYKHVGDFWSHKAKVPLPGVGDYNDAVDMTNREKANLMYLAGSWALVGLIESVRSLF